MRDHGQPQPLDEKYRPRTLADLRGQGWVSMELQRFAASPYPAAFIFAGETGLGKSSAAAALANDLECPAYDLTQIRSGQLDGEMLASVETMLRYAPMHRGWRVIVCEEADQMTPKAARLFYTLLEPENIPARTVIIFTTNRLDWFDQRAALRDRCEVYRFEDRAAVLAQDAESLIADIWRAEGGPGDPPALADLGPVIDPDGRLSFRRVVKALGQHLRRAEPFSLAPPKAPQRSLFAACGPFGTRAASDGERPADRTTAPPAASPGHGDPIPLDDGDIIDVEPLPDDEPADLHLANTLQRVNAAPPGAGRSEPAPVAARRYVWGLPPESGRPSVKSIATRFGISWDTARRVVNERWPEPVPASA